MDTLSLARNNGIKSMLSPMKLVGEYSSLLKHESNKQMVETLDFSSADLEKNRAVMINFKNMRDIDVKTVNWFLPYYKHGYGGIQTILRFADFFESAKGIENRFVFYGNANGSEQEINSKISKSYPHLSNQKITILKNREMDSVLKSDISIATMWTSAYYLLRFNNTKGKFYFIQDFEPSFYSASIQSALSEASYRFGFNAIVNTKGLYDSSIRNYSGEAEYFSPTVDKNIFYPDEKIFEAPSNQNPFKIFFYSRVENPRNCLELGFGALERLKNKYGNLLTIYAAGSNWNPKNYCLEGKIENLGLLKYEETAALYRKCDAGVIFTLSKHPSYLPFELMACGCPVLTNYNEATTWFLKEGFNCLITQPSISCVIEKIELLMNNPDLRKQLSLNALASFPNTTWQAEMEKIHNFICRKQGS